ncbi:hypothetical protein [Xanthocytophaga agilis]|nr:hypothetical protein [Xanthocytophaga agilis]
MLIRYTAIEKFGPHNRESWINYVSWSKLCHLQEVISLDPMLCPSIVEADFEKDNEYLIWENFTSDQYSDLNYLKVKLKDTDNSLYHILAVVKEPEQGCERIALANAEFVGYDLVDTEGSASALTNCGGFEETFSPKDLNVYGLIPFYEKAYSIREALIKNNPHEHHADCYVWAIWRIK